MKILIDTTSGTPHLVYLMPKLSLGIRGLGSERTSVPDTTPLPSLR